MSAKSPITTDPGAGTSISVVGDTYRILVSGEQTGGAYAAIDMLIPPGGGPGPHAHADLHETFFVVEGEIVVRAAGQLPYTARKGAFVAIPKGGIVHDFKNESDRTAHLISYVTPAGLEDFFLEIGKPVEWQEFLSPPEMTAQEQARIKEIAERHGQKLYPPDYLDDPQNTPAQ